MEDEEYEAAVASSRTAIDGIMAATAAPLARMRAWLQDNPSSRPRWMVVDDDPRIRHAVLQVLKKYPVVLLEASSGEEALQRGIRECQLALIDGYLGSGMTGLELFLAVRGPKCVFMSGYPIIVDIGDATHCEYLEKPFDLAQLDALALRVLNRAA